MVRHMDKATKAKALKHYQNLERTARMNHIQTLDAPSQISNHLEDMTAQRDALAAALRDLLADATTWHMEDSPYSGSLIAARAALAQVRS